MSTNTSLPGPSRPGASPPTYAEALAVVESWIDLTEQRRRLLKTALRTVLALEGLPAETARLDPVRSVALFERATAVELGIKPGTRANRSTAFRYVLRRLGLLAPRRRVVPPVSDPAWTPLLELVPVGPDFGRLRAFAAHCAGAGIAPGQVNGTTLDAYAEDRAGSHGGTKARDHARRVANQWNRAAREIPGWPQVRLGLTAVPLQRTLPFEAYPETLQVEACAYLETIGNPQKDLYAGPPRRALERSTVVSRKYGLRGLLFGAVQSGISIDALASLRDVIQPDTLKASLRWHHARKGRRVTSDVVQLAATAASIGQYLDIPPEERPALKAALAPIKLSPRNELTENNTRILNALDDPATRARFLHLPQYLMRKAARLRDGWTDPKTRLAHVPRPVDAAWLSSTAVAIEILLHAPMRMENLYKLTIGQELRLAAVSRGRWRGTILIEGATTKNGIGLEVPLQGESLDLIRDYLDNYRPSLPHSDTTWLFPGEASPEHPRHKGAFGLAITEGIHEGVGLRINPHAFRAIAGSFILEANPQAIDDVRAMLGHASFETALKYYRRQNQRAAANRLSTELSRQRRSTRLQAGAQILAPDIMRGRGRAAWRR